MLINISFREEKLPDGRVCASLEFDGKIFRGVGLCSRTARCAAAKYALQAGSEQSTNED